MRPGLRVEHKRTGRYGTVTGTTWKGLVHVKWGGPLSSDGRRLVRLKPRVSAESLTPLAIESLGQLADDAG